MSNPYFKFKQFTINQQNTAMKVGVDAVLLGAWANPEKAARILDIGTGTGLLSLMLAQKSKAPVTTIEIDAESNYQALENIKASKWSDRIEVLKISLQEFALQKVDKFDFIICNPPFFNGSLVSPDDKRTLARHDVSLGLKDIFSCLTLLLDIKGSFLMIYQYNRKEEVISEAMRNMLYPSKVLEIKGNEKKKPNRIIFEFGWDAIHCEASEIIVRDSLTNEYTAEYKKLTKDYYLNF